MNKHSFLACATAFVAALAITTSSFAAEDASLQGRKEMTSGDAFGIAIKEGKVRGILVGPDAANLKSQTHSNEPSLIDVTKGETMTDGCQVLYMTLNQPNVPTRSGANAGNYVAKTKLTICRDGRAPLAEVVSCTVGMRSCMPTP